MSRASSESGGPRGRQGRSAGPGPPALYGGGALFSRRCCNIWNARLARRYAGARARLRGRFGERRAGAGTGRSGRRPRAQSRQSGRLGARRARRCLLVGAGRRRWPEAGAKLSLECAVRGRGGLGGRDRPGALFRAGGCGRPGPGRRTALGTGLLPPSGSSVTVCD